MSDYKSLLDVMSPPQVNLGMLAKWGTPQDNAIRNSGTQIPGPVIDPKTPLNFEQRILRPNDYPSIDNGDGTDSTHRMAYSESDNQYYAYPTIVQASDGKLVPLGDREAWEYARSTGEFRKFGSEKDAADYAAGGYKKFWGLGEKK